MSTVVTARSPAAARRSAWARSWVTSTIEQGECRRARAPRPPWPARRAPRWARRAAAPRARAPAPAPASRAAARPPRGGPRRARRSPRRAPPARADGRGRSRGRARPGPYRTFSATLPGSGAGSCGTRHCPPPQLERVEFAHVVAAEAHGARDRVGQPVEQPQQGRLARPRGAEQRGGAGLDDEVEVAQHRAPAAGRAHLVQLEERAGAQTVAGASCG